MRAMARGIVGSLIKCGAVATRAGIRDEDLSAIAKRVSIRNGCQLEIYPYRRIEQRTPRLPSMISVDTDLVSVTEDGTVTTIELDRPDKLNALTPEMVEGLASAFEQLVADPGLPVLVDGAGRVTTAGMDQDIVGGGDYEAEYGDLNERLGTVYDLTMSYPRPVVVCGRGALVGAGAILSFAAEFCVLGDDVHFAVPEVSYAIASRRITDRLPDIAGRRIAAEMALTGEPLDPQRAYQVGLANDVVPADEVRPRARELLEVVAEHDEETVGEYVDMLNEWASPDL